MDFPQRFKFLSKFRKNPATATPIKNYLLVLGSAIQIFIFVNFTPKVAR
jgi:hypothetical protein